MMDARLRGNGGGERGNDGQGCLSIPMRKPCIRLHALQHDHLTFLVAHRVRMAAQHN